MNTFNFLKIALVLALALLSFTFCEAQGGEIIQESARDTIELSAEQGPNEALIKADEINSEEGSSNEFIGFDSSLFYIFFHGVLWVQILYSLFSFLITRERTSLYYSLLLFGLSMLFMIIYDLVNFSFWMKIPKEIWRVILMGSPFHNSFWLAQVCL